MNILKDYLNQNFSSRASHEHLPGWFRDHLGVVIKTEPIDDDPGELLYLFKYHQLEAKWLEPVVHACRGTIMSYDETNGWLYESRPFDKFFNLHEGHCPLFSDEALEERLQTTGLIAAEKVDGSLLQMWWDQYKGEWRISSSGAITPVPIGPFGETLEDLFWENHPMIDNGNPAVLEAWKSGNYVGTEDQLLNKNCTFLFELHTRHNMIVTDYGRARLVLLGIRNNTTGAYARHHISRIEGVFGGAPYRQVGAKNTVACGSSDLVSNRKELLQWIEDQHTQNPEKYGHMPEGFVLKCPITLVPLAKIKTDAYVQSHRLSDKLRWEKTAINAVFTNTYDDVCGALSEMRREIADAHRDEITEMQKQIISVARGFEGRVYKTQKAYALAVQEKFPKGVLPQYQAFFFRCKDSVLSGRDLESVFTGWVKEQATSLTRAFARRHKISGE